MWPDIEEIYNHVYGRCQTADARRQMPDSGCEFLIIIREWVDENFAK